MVMLGPAVYAIIVDTLLSSSLTRSKKAPCVETHFSHLSMSDKVVDAEEYSYYRNNIQREREEKSKDKADSNRDCYPHQLDFKKLFNIRIQQISLVMDPKKMFLQICLKHHILPMPLNLTR